MKLVQRIFISSLLLIILYLITRRSDRLRKILSVATSNFSETWGALVNK